MAPLAPVAGAFVAGVLIARAVASVASPSVVAALGAGALLLGGIARRGRLGAAALLLGWAALGALRGATAEHRPAHDLSRLAASEAAPAALHGVIVDDPVEAFGAAAAARAVAVLDVDAARLAGGGWRRTAGRVRVRIADARAPLAYGDELLLEGLLSEPPGPRNPGQFDWRAALARQGIRRLLAVRGHDPVIRLGAGRGYPILLAVDRVRRRWERLLDRYFSVGDAGLLRSLLLGQRVALDEDLKRAFVETGTVHLLPTQMRRKSQAAPASHVPYKRQSVKKLSSRHTNYTTVYFSLTAEQARKLREAAKKALVTESAVLRRMLDAYLVEVDKPGLPAEPYGKRRFRRYEERVVARTITKEQDATLRELAEKTGRSLSTLVREAVEKRPDCTTR
jgi:predicted DNA-binding protein